MCEQRDEQRDGSGVNIGVGRGTDRGVRGGVDGGGWTRWPTGIVVDGVRVCEAVPWAEVHVCTKVCRQAGVDGGGSPVSSSMKTTPAVVSIVAHFGWAASSPARITSSSSTCAHRWGWGCAGRCELGWDGGVNGCWDGRRGAGGGRGAHHRRRLPARGAAGSSRRACTDLRAAAGQVQGEVSEGVRRGVRGGLSDWGCQRVLPPESCRIAEWQVHAPTTVPTTGPS